MSEEYVESDGTEDKQSSGGWVWIIVIIVILVLVGLAIWFGIVAFRRDENRLLIVNGVQFNVPSDGTIQATWTSTNNSNDELVLYVSPSSDQMTFNVAGVPQGSYLNSGTPSPSTAGSIPTTTSSSAGSASITGLDEGTYIAILVVTNPNISDKSFTQTSKSLPVKTKPIPVIFSITAAGESGAIRYEPSSMPTEVGYEVGKISPPNVKFHHDSDGHICVANVPGTFTATSICDEGSRVLYAATDNDLDIAVRPDPTSGTVSPITSANSEWIYTNGKWCLKNNQASCMFLNRSPTPTPTPTPFRTLNTPSGEVSGTIQKITVSTSADVNKWKNQEITT